MDVKTPNDLKQCGYHYLFYSRGEVGIPGMEGTRKASLIHRGAAGWEIQALPESTAVLA